MQKRFKKITIAYIYTVKEYENALFYVSNKKKEHQFSRTNVLLHYRIKKR